MDDKVYIFISHSHKDIDKVRKIRNYIESLNAEPLLFFLKSLTDTDQITKLIKDEIDVRLWFIYCDSPNARKSDWVKSEKDYIKQTNKQTSFTIDLINEFDSDGELGNIAKFKIKNHILNIEANRTFFFSYSHRDKALIEKIENFLLKYDIILKRDKEFMLGENWFDSMQNMIKTSKYFLMFISKKSLSSLFVKEEISHANRLGKTIIPVLINIKANDIKVLNEEIYMLISSYNFYEFDWENINMSCSDLMNYIVKLDIE